MEFLILLESLSSILLSLLAVIILLCALIITISTRFVQFRALKKIFQLLFSSITQKTESQGSETISPHKALFTAMSTTIGVSVIAAPVITMKLGGPGALFYFLLSNVLGSAVCFAEVTFALNFRKKLQDGRILGGPMEYIKKVLPPFFSSWYAIFAFIVLLMWSALQANTLADLMVDYYIPSWITGVMLSTLVVVTLLGGIKRIGNISEKLVPVMFFLYASAGLYIVFVNLYKLPAVLDLVFRSAITPKAIIGGSVFGGVFQAIRYGFLRGINANEAGIGTGSFPHSMAETKNPSMQGILSMLSLYSHGFLCLLSGLVVLLTGTWEDPNIRFGISAVTQAFFMYFSYLGPLILSICAILFIFGTILGNCYNGEQCVKYLIKGKYKTVYYTLIAILIFVGSIVPVKKIWLMPDYIIVLVALPNIIGILLLSFKYKNLLKIE